MSEKRDEIEMTARHTSTSVLKVFSASYHQSTVRLETDGLSRIMLKYQEVQEQVILKPDSNTLIAMRDVLNRWYEAEIVKRGNP